MSKCVHCKEKVELDMPETSDGGYYALNPKTKRQAIQHTYCHQVVFEDLTDEENESLELFELEN